MRADKCQARGNGGAGSATDIAILEEAELAQADVAVALMGDSAANLAFSLLARGMGVPRIVARMPNPQYRTAYEQAGVTGIIDLAGLFIDAVILEIEHPQVQQVGVFADGQGIVIALYASKPNRGLGKTAAQIHSDKRFPRGCLIAGIVRNGRSSSRPGRPRSLPETRSSSPPGPTRRGGGRVLRGKAQPVPPAEIHPQPS